MTFNIIGKYTTKRYQTNAELSDSITNSIVNIKTQSVITALG